MKEENNTPNGEYKIQRPIEIKCSECGLVSIPKYQLERNDVGNKDYIYSDGCLTLCDKCMKNGWTDNPKEIIEALNKDPKFQVGYLSPLQQIDLL